MASVSSLDQDMRKLRLDRYTPSAANEARNWIESSLGESLPSGDLMEVLRDGVALCKLVNQTVSPGVRFKASNMPFVQMENISHFLKACELPPLSLPAHDRFLTVDLYDQKDPAQVLQCIAAFSRRANAIKPSAFPTTIGAKTKGGAMSPQGTGGNQTASSYTMNTPLKQEPQLAFNSLNKASYSSPGKPSNLSRGGLASGGPVSSWSTSADESATAPAWNIHQYGYMGGASQGNQGVAFGARRQITSQAPHVPSLAEKEKRRKEIEGQQQQETADDERRAQATVQQNEAKQQREEEQRWNEETRKLREQEEEDEKKAIAKQEEEERAVQAKREQEQEAKFALARNQQRQASDSRLNGQFLSQYNAERKDETRQEDVTREASAESQRIAELERQLAEMKAVEKKRQEQDEGGLRVEQARKAAELTNPALASSDPQTSHEDDWDASERDYLKKQWQTQKEIEAEDRTPAKSRPADAFSGRQLPDPNSYTPGTNRTDRFLSSNPAPKESNVVSHRPSDYSTTTEVDLENQRRVASQQKTKAGGWASKSLLEREMERERERQREWEENQKVTAARTRDPNEGAGPGQTWDVHQYGYTGGDNQNRGGPGLGIGGPRRQIIGPRPPP